MKNTQYQTWEEVEAEERWEAICRYTKYAFFLSLGILIAVFAFSCNTAQAAEVYIESKETYIDFKKIAQIESSNNPLAHNKKDDSRGLFQITPICLKEYNSFHKSAPYSANDLWNPAVNFKVAEWYLNKRIPQMLKHYGLKDSVENRIVCFNAGISYLVKNKALPKITVSYLQKYARAK